MWDLETFDEQSVPIWNQLILDECRRHDDWTDPLLNEFRQRCPFSYDLRVGDTTLQSVLRDGLNAGHVTIVMDDRHGLPWGVQARCCVCVPPDRTRVERISATCSAAIDVLDKEAVAVVRVGPDGRGRLEPRLQRFAHLGTEVHSLCMQGSCYELRRAMRTILSRT
jgi:hypothetical protein